MQAKHQSLINSKVLITALIVLIAGYIAMSMMPGQLFRLTLAPIIIIIGFVMVVLSVIIPEKK